MDTERVLMGKVSVTMTNGRTYLGEYCGEGYLVDQRGVKLKLESGGVLFLNSRHILSLRVISEREK